MKYKNIKIYSWLAVALMLVTTSCRDDTFSDYWDDNSDEFTVTLNVGLEGMTTSTKAIKARSIGDGSKIDMLVYAVYYNDTQNGGTDEDPKWEAATEYVKQYENNQEKPFNGEVQPGHGQTILDVSETLQQPNGHQPITLTLKKGQNYKVVFWAQNHETKAFVIDDLKRVQMKYKNLEEETQFDEDGNKIIGEDGKEVTKDKILSVNNDEARDAFCRSIDLDGNQSNRNITIYLRRPVAQINVGTHGFDYETITRNSDKNEKYLYSKIRINRAARYLDVLNDRVYKTTIESEDPNGTTEAFYTIDYEYEKLPAYWLFEGDEVPEFPSYTKYDLEDDNGKENSDGAYESFVLNNSGFFSSTDEKSQMEEFRRYYGREEFLKVRLFEHTAEDKEKYKDFIPAGKDDFDYIPYQGMGDWMDSDDSEKKRSEVFKYLSMCYVLTDSSDEYQDVLTNVKVWLAKDKDGRDEVEIANLTNVPVQRNHRTNIVGSLLTAEAKMQIVVDQDFGGGKIYGENNIQSGEIAEGFYYDATNNEFQISSVNGLLFFQQLVNGDLKIRQITNPNADGAVLKGQYPYKLRNDESGNVYWLESKSWKYEILGEEKAELLLKALEIKGNYTTSDNIYYTRTFGSGNDSYTVELMLNEKQWPAYNNFSFYGKTVKLMADIDLSGIEWIPIGFDCANWDSSIGENGVSLGDSNKEISSTNYRSIVVLDNNKRKIIFDHRRVFAGTFDGNGHTIYNLTTKQFGSEVMQYNQQLSSNAGPYDNIPWFGRGLFGLCGPGVVIKDLRLQNVNVQGNNGVAGIVAVVSSKGFEAKIDNCIVDGGNIAAIPLYRFEQNTSLTDRYYGRTHARGVYAAGIVGQFVAYGKNSGVTNCEVRNLTIKGFRRIGGIIGSIADQSTTSLGDNWIQLDIEVKGNSVRNSLLLCQQYVPFDRIHSSLENNIWKNGFGWATGDTFSPMSDIIVGGDLEKVDCFAYSNYAKSTTRARFYSDLNQNNFNSNVQYSVLSTTPNQNRISLLKHKPLNNTRESEIGNISLEQLPAFSSLFVDEVNLTNNYYGKAPLKTKIKFNNEAEIWRGPEAKLGGSGNNFIKFIMPFAFPNGEGINYDSDASNVGNAGMYIETVYITGENAPGKRSVITPTDVYGVNSCVMYITARDRKQFTNKLMANNAGQPGSTSDLSLESETTVKNIVLRGSPYAWAGIILAPNANMSKVTLDNVTIYDVYKTLTLQEESTSVGIQTIQNYTYWYDYNLTADSNGKYSLTGTNDHISVDLEALNCNFRGYTVPGKGWEQVTYTNTTFEPGSETKYSYSGMHDNKYENEYKTVKVEAKTTFDHCFFKAPFYIDLEEVRGGDSNNPEVDFNNCYGASAYGNVKIRDITDEVYYISIDKDTEAGKTVIKHHRYDGSVITSYNTNQ